MDDTRLCDNCGVKPIRTGAWRPTECTACHRYRMRTGSPRPQYLIERQLRAEDQSDGE